MSRSLALAAVVCLIPAALSAAPPKPLVTGLKNPESVAVLDGKIYVSTIGEFNKDGDGAVMLIENGQARPIASNLNDPKGIIAARNSLYVTDKDRVLRIDAAGKTSVFAAADAFPSPPQFLNDIVADERGQNFYVSDTGAGDNSRPAVYKIDDRRRVSLVADAAKAPILKAPNGLLMDSHLHLLILDFATGELHRLNNVDATTEKYADGFKGGDGLAWDHFGRLYISSWQSGTVWVIGRPGEKKVTLAEGFQSAADVCLAPDGRQILVPDMKAGTLSALPIGVPGLALDERPMPIATEIAFPDLEWANWTGEVDGRPLPLRPIELTHANDGSNRVFVATQRGVIHVFPNDQKATKTQVFLDIQDQTRYADRENEEGFLGMAFHPRYKENGEFYVLHTIKRLTNVITRFRVSKDDPNRADRASGEEIFRIDRPYWNHAGGTIVFGPDGYLYVVFGDGGSANDPHENGQNLGTLLGSVARIDVNTRAPGLKYGIPKDNPFVNTAGARPEIFCYGVRNPWRIAFDRETGVLWCGDVGQNVWEEINLLTPGGNYGWNRREGQHAFGPKGRGASDKFIDPIWEYHHDLGKSITGGTVYRGKQLPDLVGHYVYADYVSNKIWALKYDAAANRVVANRPIADPNVPILSFGEDQDGELYFMTFTPTGQGIHRFVAADPPK
ncbi:MAG TPA: PQQ-dependent sugar dehydrogenase [Pirellulales bacterium]|nr:PQQ-dependent sugar dehydrogenase [Pirellulales bacterium]